MLASNVFSQKLKRLDSIADKHSAIFQEYISECYQGRYFFGDKGIVQMTTFKDSLDNDCFWLSACIDDHYLENLTDSYFFFGSQLFLVYKGDKNGQKIKNSPNKELKKALKNIVEDRVYIRPKEVTRWIEVKYFDGKPKKVLSKTITYGNHWNSTVYIFNKFGNYRKLKAV